MIGTHIVCAAVAAIYAAPNEKGVVKSAMCSCPLFGMRVGNDQEYDEKT